MSPVQITETDIMANTYIITGDYNQQLMGCRISWVILTWIIKDLLQTSSVLCAKGDDRMIEKFSGEGEIMLVRQISHEK
jgi:hypothetical protein